MSDLASGSECAEAFEMASREAVRAWSRTSLLAMTASTNVQQMESVLCDAAPAALTDFFCDLAGPSFAAYSVQSGMDSEKAMRMSRIVLGLLAREIKPGGGQDHMADVLLTLHRRAKAWIESGSPGEGCARASEQLASISALADGQPQIRLALAAPFAPAFAVCGVVVRARKAGYPFAVNTQVK